MFSLLVLNMLIAQGGAEFLWGSATASYQVEGAVKEGGRGATVWDTFSHTPGKIDNGDNGDVADDEYHRFKEDISLLTDMGINSYRFSIAWSRIFPDGEAGPVNQAGVDYYNGVIDALLQAGVAPLATLFHWDTPLALEEKYGGWLSAEMETHFANFADTCFQLFGDRVKHWITINEPMSVAINGYSVGIHAPGRCSDGCRAGDSAVEPYIVSHNMLNAHAAAVSVYRNKYQATQKGLIGITLNSDFAYPLDPSSNDDIAAAERNLEFQAGWYADPVYFGHYPQSMVERVGDRLPQFSPEQSARIKGSSDFYGLNHYTSKFAANNPSTPTPSGGWSDDQGTLISNTDSEGQLIGPQADSDWLNVVPSGMYDILSWISLRYGRPMILITENGVDVPGEVSMQDALRDTFRIQYYSGYLSNVQRAIVDGVDVQGYFAWSLLDNFEWNNGFGCRFGLTYVDYEGNLTRHVKDSSVWYANYIKQHRLINSIADQK